MTLSSESGIEIEVVEPGRVADFLREHEREALSTAWSFRVVQQEQRHVVAGTRGDTVFGMLELRIAASLAHLERLIVAADERRRGVGTALVLRAEDLAKYYNCHKVTLEVPAAVGNVREFFESIGYKTEAILPQHTWKLDVAILRKFLL